MDSIIKKVTMHLTDAQFKADLDEHNNYLAQDLAKLLAFQQQLNKDLEELEPEDFDQTYIHAKAIILGNLIMEVTETGRGILDRLTERSCLLSVREELRQEQNRKNKRR